METASELEALSADLWIARVPVRIVRPIWTAFSDGVAARRSLDQLLDTPFETLVVGHGERVRHAARAALAEAHTWL